MNHRPIQVYPLCPACSECPAVEIFSTGQVRIGEAPNVVSLTRAEWNQLVRAVRRGELAELPAE